MNANSTPGKYAAREGYAAVTPWVVSHDTAGLLDFLGRAFGAVELARVSNADGSIGHAEIRIGDAVVMLFDGPVDWPETPAFLRLFVDDADALLSRAVAAGATPVSDVTHLAFGDRVGRVRDPFGNIWWLQARVEDVSEKEMAERWEEPKWAKAMEYMQTSLIDALKT
ncbi:MAG: VOC family protein [Mesorhizobium sp.]